MRLFKSLALAVGLFVLTSLGSHAAAQEVALDDLLDQLVEDGSLVAAQAVVGHREQIWLDCAVGVTSPGGEQEVNAETLFCIGSCSKPVAAAVAMKLVESGAIKLEQPISDFLPSFGNLHLTDGTVSKGSPTLKDLLSHRSGIYSQHEQRLTDSQRNWIRDFELTLEESVNGIAKEPLFSHPGTNYAYSGAGYCVVGRVSEVVSDKSFEQLLQQDLATPLKLERTTYFPDESDNNIAAGGGDGKPNPFTPHLTKPLRLPLIGGSLYSTAQETARFLCMVAQQGQYGDTRVMSTDICKTWLSRPYPEGNYGFGWVLEGTPPGVFSHKGALSSSRSTLVVVPNAGIYGVVHYTIAPLKKKALDKISSDIQEAMVRSMLLAAKTASNSAEHQ